MAALLTIVIPTFNRGKTLALLLGAITKQLEGLENQVNIIIGDNASTDETQSIAQSFLISYPTATILRHTENVGPEENFCRCLDRIQTKYFWIIGDDDLPKSFTLKPILRFLASKNPDLLYLNSEWIPAITNESNGIKLQFLSTIKLSRQEFSRYVNVWLTFISGMIVNRERLLRLQPDLNIRQFTGTSLVQLGWVLPLLMKGERFFFILQPCILATSGNSGGYKLLEVFAKNFPEILQLVCGKGSTEFNFVMRGLVRNYIPSLIWMCRFQTAKTFLQEDISRSTRSLRAYPTYWLLSFPILTSPKSIAYAFWFISRVFGVINRFSLRLKLILLKNPDIIAIERESL